MKKILILLILVSVILGCEIFVKDVENINISVNVSENPVAEASLNNLKYTFTLETENTSDAPITLKSYQLSIRDEKEEFSGISLVDKDDSRELSGISYEGLGVGDSFQVYFYFDTDQDVELKVISPTINIIN